MVVFGVRIIIFMELKVRRHTFFFYLKLNVIKNIHFRMIKILIKVYTYIF